VYKVKKKKKMSRHSKNNTSAPVFTYHERQKLKYGTISERLGKDSMKEYDACSLCYHGVKEPLSCKKGHIFCKECIYEYLLNQKSEISKQLQLYEEQERRLQEQKELEELKKKEKEIIQFDKSVLSVIPTKIETSTTNESEETKKPSLPFWVPTGKDAEPSLIKKPILDIRCPEGKEPHNIKLKKLIKLSFTPNTSEDTSLGNRFQCPTCRKTLSKGMKTIALSKCGHVCCAPCFEKTKSSGVCFLCGEKFKDKDVIKIQSGGTGYAANSGDNLIAKKVTPSAWI